MTEIISEVLPEVSIYHKLAKIQEELKAPKNLYNQHGNFYYRNAETILEAAKPLCAKYGCLLRVEDDIKVIGDRFYVMATAVLTNLNAIGGKQACLDSVTSRAFAREPLEQKGMAPAMITGASSSYARKYALNGLFCIDDGQDTDSQAIEVLKPEDFAIKYSDVTMKLKNYDFDPRNEKTIEWVKSKTGVDTLDVGKLMLNVDDGMKVLKLLEQVLEIKEGAK